MREGRTAHDVFVFSSTYEIRHVNKFGQIDIDSQSVLRNRPPIKRSAMKHASVTNGICECQTKRVHSAHVSHVLQTAMLAWHE